MKTGFRSIVVGVFLATVSSVFGAVDSGSSASEPAVPVSPTTRESGQVIVSQKAVLSDQELAKYQRLEEAAKTETKQQAAGEGMDTTTMVIIGVLAVVVIVAVASGGGGGGGGY